jgi:regulator of PEP synthase PpsR (kinase-PPPase family)
MQINLLFKALVTSSACHQATPFLFILEATKRKIKKIRCQRLQKKKKKKKEANQSRYTPWWRLGGEEV